MAQAISVSVLIPGLLLLLVVVVSMRDPLPGVTKHPFCAILFAPGRLRSGKGVYMKARRVRMSRCRGMPYHEFSRASRGSAHGPLGAGHSANPRSRHGACPDFRPWIPGPARLPARSRQRR